MSSSPAAPSSSRPAASGSFRIFRFAGVDVYIHWSWFVVAYFLIRNRDRMFPYSSYAWDIAEYVAGFALVTLHEFGHVFACRSVGGYADRVVLWPLGGLAFVAPPPRPGPSLWTAAAGPLVNLVLAPLLFVPAFFLAHPALDGPRSDIDHFCLALFSFNLVMLLFNLLPIYPMDGGRILQALLWWPFGRSWSLAIAAGIGAFFSAAAGLTALFFGEYWLAFLAAFLLLGALAGIAQSRQLARIAEVLRRPEFCCPNCGESPPEGNYWRCIRCLAWFDAFAPATSCTHGEDHFAPMSCPDCGRELDAEDWLLPLEESRGDFAPH